MQRPALTGLLTLVAMLAFAANSILCRLALGNSTIDAASFTSIRVIAGAVMLALISICVRKKIDFDKGNWRSAISLFFYMVFFSFAYLSLSAGTGALILFGSVQLTMFVVALRSGESFSLISWFGLALAIGGLIYLVSPGISAPNPLGTVLMAVAGVAWGAYSLFGRTTANPLAATTTNFIFCVPLVLAVSVFFVQEQQLQTQGILLAVASGALASGLGYAVWYAALTGLSGTRAATVQLSVPVIAALGGVIFLAEEVTLRLTIASIATLGGVLLVLIQRQSKAKSGG